MFNALPQEYRVAPPEELRARIAAAREQLGSRLTILAHHYQRLEVCEFADHIGDSYGLSKIAAAMPEVDYIVFCGVHFMAESADILAQPDQTTFLPNPLAGCPMADMAEVADVMEAWAVLNDLGVADRTIPVSYMNTAAGLKAFTGKNGGLICTSSNANGALEWSLSRGDKVFFFPDEHLGYNTAVRFGVPRERIVFWDFAEDQGGLTDEQIREATVILWKGHCHVHTNFSPEHIDQMRETYPDVRIIVHPECPPAVVDKADAFGSTKFITEYCESAPAGAVIAIGTEVNLINRMAHYYPDKTILELSGQTCAVCANMYRTTLNDLAFCLERIDDFKPIRVPEHIKADARLALERMLEIPK